MKTIYTFVRYYRKPYPSGNWCPRYSTVFKGKELVEVRLNSTSIVYDKKGNATVGYRDAANIVHDYKEKHGLEWENILDLSEVELAVSEFKQYENMFKAKLDAAKKEAKK